MEENVVKEKNFMDKKKYTGKNVMGKRCHREEIAGKIRGTPPE